MTVDDLVAASLEDEHKRELLARAIQESARATEEHQIIGLARAFATGAISEDRAIVDESMVALETIGQLRGPHWRLVSILIRPSPSGESDHMNFRSGKPYALPWLRRDIIEEDPGLAPVIDSLIAKLLGLGMIEDRAHNVSDGRPRWALTGFGHACADYMRILGHNQAAS
ncbi:hypothetical protein HC031_15105 [Planosporangium thailandense]|uniref:Uncharacterized protein n=1 Tax=Planosporangium thailandense TaxID=765197 RepID=A0ABX0XYD1_9ACTN|nr:hypothetical protein [Planosporangium thailandense]